MSDYENINRWRDHCTTGRHAGSVLSLARCNVFADGNRLHSYGRHFTLATWLPDMRLFVINGDRSSVTTNGHNRAVISALRGHDTVIIPYSALSGAGIDVATIRPIDVRPDRSEPIPHSVASVRDVPQWRRARTLYRDATAETLDNVPRQHHDMGYREIATGQPVEVDYSTYPHTYKTADGRTVEGISSRMATGDTCEWTARIRPDANGLYTWRESYSVEDAAHLLADNGRYEWIEDRHVLGDSLFTAVSAGRRRTWLSSFDYQERNPLYFLCEMPRGHGSVTVADAIAALSPPAVKHAVANGRAVKRQGDIFAVPVELPDALIYGRARGRARLTQWTRGSKPRTGEIGYRKPLTGRQYLWRIAARERYVKRVFRERFASYLLSATAVAQPATDKDYMRGSYWRTHPHATYNRTRGRDAYRKRTRNAAWSILSNVRHESRLRYPISSGYTEEDRARLRDTLSIHGTAHSCTEMVITAGGVTYGRGILYHAVDLEGGSRTPDHARVSLGDRWHVMVRNTVPRQRNTNA